MGRALCAKDEGTDGAPVQTQGGLSTFSLPTDQSGHRPDQPDAARLGQLLPHRAVESMLWVREGLGREEGQAPSDARAQRSGFWLEAVE